MSRNQQQIVRSLSQCSTVFNLKVLVRVSITISQKYDEEISTKVRLVAIFQWYNERTAQRLIRQDSQMRTYSSAFTVQYQNITIQTEASMRKSHYSTIFRSVKRSRGSHCVHHHIQSQLYSCSRVSPPRYHIQGSYAKTMHQVCIASQLNCPSWKGSNMKTIKSTSPQSTITPRASYVAAHGYHLQGITSNVAMPRLCFKHAQQAS